MTGFLTTLSLLSWDLAFHGISFFSTIRVRLSGEFHYRFIRTLIPIISVGHIGYIEFTKGRHIITIPKLTVILRIRI